MTSPWPKLETALVSTALHFGYEVREDHSTGDKYLEIYIKSADDGSDLKTEINLTEAAKVLWEEL